MNIISFLCTLMIVGQDFQSFTDDLLPMIQVARSRYRLKLLSVTPPIHKTH
jgi:hypothetical protein